MPLPPWLPACPSQPANSPTSSPLPVFPVAPLCSWLCWTFCAERSMGSERVCRGWLGEDCTGRWLQWTLLEVLDSSSCPDLGAEVICHCLFLKQDVQLNHLRGLQTAFMLEGNLSLRQGRTVQGLFQMRSIYKWQRGGKAPVSVCFPCNQVTLEAEFRLVIIRDHIFFKYWHETKQRRNSPINFLPFYSTYCWWTWMFWGFIFHLCCHFVCVCHLHGWHLCCRSDLNATPKSKLLNMFFSQIVDTLFCWH